ncbi:MAG: helix-turn-helix domain-containing protein [Calditrichia bacterium]
METYWIKRLDQAALLSDSFKLTLLEHFADEPATIKQVAALMKVKQTRLYRHIDALAQAGLLKVVREQPKRGTVERHYQAVARRFEIDSSLFASEPGEKSEAAQVLQNMLRDTENEVLPLLDISKEDASAEDELSAILLRVSVQGSEAQMKALRNKLMEWLKECEELEPDEEDTPHLAYRGLMFFYPTPERNGQES